MTDMRATERLLEVIEGRIETIIRQFDRGDDTADVEAAMFTIREHALSIQTEITELRRRGDTLVRRHDLVDAKLSDEVRLAMAERMNRLPMVRWDRCVLHDATAVAYGWIYRLVDGRSDFVLLDFAWGETLGLAGDSVMWLSVGFSTSSAEHSHAISTALGFGEGHNDCERIEDVFGTAVDRLARQS